MAFRIGRMAAVAALAAALILLAATPARGEWSRDESSHDDPSRLEGGTRLLGPLRVRDMTPFNLVRLDMRPAHAIEAGPGSWGIETDLLYSNTFVMSGNVRAYLEGRGTRSPLTQADADAILGLGEDAYYVDGEFALLNLTFHYNVTRRSSVYLTLAAYDFTGGFLDGTIESFHDSFGFSAGGRDLVARDGFQVVSSIGGARLSSLDASVEAGLGDPVVGVRHFRPLGGSRWGIVFSGEAKLAWRGERLFLSTGTHDFGVQAALQGKFRRQAIYLGANFVSTDGRVFGVHLDRRVVPTLTAAYEAGVTGNSSLIVQLYASESTGRDSAIPEIRADKYQASVGLHSRRGSVIYGFAVTENLRNYENTPDVGVSLSLAWVSLRP